MGNAKWPQADRQTQVRMVSLVKAPALARRITGDTFYAWDGEVLVLNILGKPAAARDAIGKVHGTQLKVSVTPRPRPAAPPTTCCAFWRPSLACGWPTSR